MNTPVSFEISKLLKEKKFASNDEGCEGCYINNRYTREEYLFYKDNIGIYPAPTIAEVVMWIYEKHKIWIEVQRTAFYREEVRFQSFMNSKPLTGDMGGHVSQKTPTEAYSAAILYCLENLIK